MSYCVTYDVVLQNDFRGIQTSQNFQRFDDIESAETFAIEVQTKTNREVQNVTIWKHHFNAIVVT